jgi:protein SCO1
MTYRVRECLGVAMLLALGAAAHAWAGQTGSAPQLPASLPGDSLFQLPVTLETADRGVIKLSDLRGRPLLLTMFYTQCTNVCPLLTSRVQALVGGLPPGARQGITVLMVSLDSARDGPEALRTFQEQHGIKAPNWVLAHASPQDVRLLSAAVGIRFRELPDHTFNHSALICLTDREGVIKARSSNIGNTDEEFARALRNQLVANR